MFMKSSEKGYLSFARLPDERDRQNDRGRTWSEGGDLWDYTLTFKGALPCKGSIRAVTKAEAIKYLKARHFANKDESDAANIEVHGKSNNQTKGYRK